jgi:hypothetical protein
VTRPLDDDAWGLYDTRTDWTQPNQQAAGTWLTWFIQTRLAQVWVSTLTRLGL